MNHSSHFQSDAQTYTYKNRFEKPLEIFGSAEAFSSDSDEVHLVADAFDQAEELGFRQCDLPKVRKLSARANLRVQIPIVAMSRASCRVDPYPDNVHTREGH